jgi:hypothetical protein
MRGFPPIQIFLLVLAFIVLAIPLSHLTGNAQEKSAPQAVAKEKQNIKALLRLRFAHKPSTLSLKIAGKELITAIDSSPIEIDAGLLRPKKASMPFSAPPGPTARPTPPSRSKWSPTASKHAARHAGPPQAALMKSSPFPGNERRDS